MRFLILSLLICFQNPALSATLEFSGAMGLEICPKNIDCFRKLEATSPTVEISEIYQDDDIVIEYGIWEEEKTVQNIGIFGGIEITKTTYKQSKDIFTDYTLFVSTESAENPIYSTLTIKGSTPFNSIFSVIGDKIGKANGATKKPIIIIASKDFILNFLDSFVFTQSLNAEINNKL